MKELYGGIFLAAALAVVVGSGLNRGPTASYVSRADMWNELHGRETAPTNRGARFSSPRSAPLKGRSPEALAEPAIAFAEEMTSRAADLGRHMRAEMGLPALITGAASALAEDEEASEEVARTIGVSPEVFAAIDPFSSPRRAGPGRLDGAGGDGRDSAALYAPLPVPRPAPDDRETDASDAEAGGIIAAALKALTSVGRSAVSEEEAPRLVVLVSPDAPDPVQPKIGYSDRADLPGLNPGPPREPFTELNDVYRDRAPGAAG